MLLFRQKGGIISGNAREETLPVCAGLAGKSTQIKLIDVVMHEKARRISRITLNFPKASTMTCYTK